MFLLPWGHLIAACPVLFGKEASLNSRNPGKKVLVLLNLSLLHPPLGLLLIQLVSIQSNQQTKGLMSCINHLLPDIFIAERRGKYQVDGVMMWHWFPSAAGDKGWNLVQQVMIPLKFHLHILCLAYDHIGGYLGIKRPYHHILQYFVWPS